MTQEEIIKERDEFKKKVSKMSKEELNKLMEEIIKESDEVDKEIKETKYKLDKKNQEACFECIRYFINKNSVKWNYALGMVTIYENFNSGYKKEIDYITLDTVLRHLGQLEYTGYDEWQKVLTINTYFENVAPLYRDITNKILNVGEKYAIVEAALQLFEKQVNN